MLTIGLAPHVAAKNTHQCSGGLDCQTLGVRNSVIQPMFLDNKKPASENIKHMKTLVTLITSLSVGSLAFAAEKEDKHGPKGGELPGAKPHEAEFVVGEDHTATIFSTTMQ